jgi:hypothetical protein
MRLVMAAQSLRVGVRGSKGRLCKAKNRRCGAAAVMPETGLEPVTFGL